MPNIPTNQQMYPMEKMNNSGHSTSNISHKINQPNQNYGSVRESFNGKSPSQSQANVQQPHYSQQYYSQSSYSNKMPHTSSSSSSSQQHMQSNTPGNLSNNYGPSQNSANFNSYQHSVPTSYQSQQNFDYNSPSSSSISTMNYATPSPSQYSFASSSPSTSTLQAPSPDIRQANLPHSSALPSLDDENDSSNRDYGISNQYKMGADNKSFNSTQHSSYNVDPASDQYNTGENCAYPTEMKSSLKKYRHKQQPSSKSQSMYGAGPSEFKMDEQYGPYNPIEGETTLSFLEKTASSIDESKSAFKSSLSNITKPTSDMIAYGAPSLYGNANIQASAKPKAKPRSRSRKTANKSESSVSSDPISTPVQSLPMKPDLMQPSSIANAKDNMINARPKATSSGWRVEEASAGNKHMPTEHYSSSMISHSTIPGEKNITIPHTDVNTTYNHSNQTYQYSGQTVVPPTPFPLSQQNKPESSMYSSHGTVHHPYTRPETTIPCSSSVTTNSNIQAQTSTTSVSNHPFSVHSSISSLHNPPQQQSTHLIQQQTSAPSSSTAFNTTPVEPSKSSQTSHNLPLQEQSSSLPHTPQVESLSLYSHSQHYSPYSE